MMAAFFFVGKMDYGVAAVISYLNRDTKTVTDQSDKPTGINYIRQLHRTVNQNIPQTTNAQIDYWLDFANDHLTKDFKTQATAFPVLDIHMATRSFFVAYSTTVADLAIWGALRGSSVFSKHLKGKGPVSTPHLVRWYHHISSLPYVDSVNKIAPVAPAKDNTVKPKDQGSFDISLKNAKMGQVVTRFPPEPSGYLHIGHIKAALLNDYFAKAYKGKMLLRFDDTNPSKEKEEFQESIKQDLARLNITYASVSHTSDHFQYIYDKAIALIKSGLAYVDDTDQETMRAERMDGINSKNRNMSIEDTLMRFDEMKQGTERGLVSCLRAKIDMQDKNKAMRDPVIYRCNLIPHIRTGTTWKIYPIYDFACPIVDSVEGVTHALRTNEYRDRNPQYDWFLKALSIRKVEIWDFSRVNFVYTLLSKRKLTWFVNEGKVSGWDDPRFPTVRGILRRGMTVEALRNYILMQGASQKDMLMEWDKIWSLNKKAIDSVAGRYYALNSDKLFKLDLSDDIPCHHEEKALHKKNPDLGMKKIIFSSKLYLEWDDAKDLEVGEEVTLMDWGNMIVKKVDVANQQIHGELNLAGDFKKTKKKLTWLARDAPNSQFELARVVLKDYDYLITKKKLEEDDQFADFVTPVSEFQVEAVADPNVKHLKQSTIIQFERKGYYIVDSAYDPKNPKKPVELIYIPDGRLSSTVSKAAATAKK